LCSILFCSLWNIVIQSRKNSSKRTLNIDVVVRCEQGDLLPDRRAERAEGDKESRTTAPAALVMIEEAELFVPVVMETSARLTYRPDWRDGKDIGRKRLKRPGTFRPDFMDRALDLADLFQFHRVVKNASVFEEQQEAPHDFRIGGTGIGPLQAAKRDADACDTTCGGRCDLPAFLEPIAHDTTLS
jgi:hypothetical protein